MPAPGVYLASSSYFVEEWLATPSITDEIPNHVWGMAVDHAVWNEPGGPRDEVHIYAAVGRAGIEVLQFLPNAQPGGRLVLVQRIETPSGMAGIKIRQEADPDQRTLLVGESMAGLRTFVYPP